jgi:hypothetical protein
MTWFLSWGKHMSDSAGGIAWEHARDRGVSDKKRMGGPQSAVLGVAME